MKISYCTTCMGRLHHLKETLPQNLEAHRGFNVEFVLLDYNSKDGLKEWVQKEVSAEIQNGRLAYYRTEEPEHFHRAHAKNVAHRLAKNEIVCNLDADNYADQEFTDYLSHLFQNSPNSITRGYGGDGFFGRVALPRTWFEELGGYDESFQGWGFEDDDLVFRGNARGLKIHDLPSQFAKVILHPRVERWEITRESNAAMSRANIDSGRLKANCGQQWGSARLTRNFGELVFV